jgi:proteic killer suppression protein
VGDLNVTSSSPAVGCIAIVRACQLSIDSLRSCMIESFRHKGLKRLYEADDARGLNPDHVVKIIAILTLLDTATAIETMDVPGFRCHRLIGNLKGFWSVTVRANWRIVFRFENGSAFDVDLVDYH